MQSIKYATVGRSDIKKDVVSSPDFIAGKGGDFEAAKRIIQKIWSQKKTDQIKENLNENAVFLSMPSSTKTNVIPIQLGSYLSQELKKLFINGDELFNTSHDVASKHIARDSRVFKERKYHDYKTEETKTLLKTKDIIIVDDIITTGSSLRYFKEFLNEKNYNVTQFVALMGDRRLELDPVTRNKLSEEFKKKGVDIDIKTIDHITRTEAGGLIRTLNKIRGKDVKCIITQSD